MTIDPGEDEASKCIRKSPRSVRETFKAASPSQHSSASQSRRRGGRTGPSGFLLLVGLLLGVALAPLAFAGSALARSGPRTRPPVRSPPSTKSSSPASRPCATAPTTWCRPSPMTWSLPALRAADRRRRPEAGSLGDLPVGRAGIGRRPHPRPGPAYTQILINGERVPEANLDRSFFVDRIPAELIKRVEVVRSSSASRSGDAVAGAINIVLRDAMSLDGGYVRRSPALGRQRLRPVGRHLRRRLGRPGRPGPPADRRQHQGPPQSQAEVLAAL